MKILQAIYHALFPYGIPTKQHSYIKSNIYNKIYIPYYNSSIKLFHDKPIIYNKEGLPLDIWFIRDIHSAHLPYCSSGISGAPKYFLWDKFNIELDTHFYSHNSMLEQMGDPIKKYGIFFESESIVPEDYKIFKKNPGLENDFNKIFTYSEQILNSVKNASLFVSCASIFYAKEIGDRTIITEKVFQEKTNNISMICSNKLYTDMHRIRHDFAAKAKETGKVDIFGTFDNGHYVQYKSDTLKNYRYQIVIENGIKSYYFTEKIMDCFISMTIPIYIGAPKINDFFDENGIISIQPSDIDSLENILKLCSENEYIARLPAIKNNFFEALKYLNIFDKLYEDYFINEEKK